MMERLSLFREAPTSWVNWEPLLGGELAHQELTRRLPGAPVYLQARASAVARTRLRGHPPGRPWGLSRWWGATDLPEASPQTPVHMLWANMGLHHEAQPLALMGRWFEHIRPGGFLLFSCLGPDSLTELRRLYAECGWPDPAHAFTDMHDLGDMLIASGFAEPVMDMEHIRLSYSSAQSLLADLRQLGRNLSNRRFPGLRGRGWGRRWCDAVEQRLPRDAEGRLLLSFEIVYGHAFKPEHRPVSRAKTQSISLSSLRESLRRPKA